MGVEWRLKQALEAHGIANASQLQRALEETLGIKISRVALDKLIKNTPAHLRLETVQILCNLLQLPLSAFLIVTPEPQIQHPVGIIQPYGKQNTPTDTIITDPMRFF